MFSLIVHAQKKKENLISKVNNFNRNKKYFRYMNVIVYLATGYEEKDFTVLIKKNLMKYRERETERRRVIII